MANDFARRFAYWVEVVQRVSYNEVARLLNITAGQVSRWRQGKVKPDLRSLQGIKAAYPSINLTWLITGEGDPLEDAGIDTGAIRIRLASAILDRRTGLGTLERVGKVFEADRGVRSLPDVQAALDALSAVEAVAAATDDEAEAQG